MTLFFDCRFIRVDHHDGISRFSSELFSAVSKQEPVTALVSDLRQLDKLPKDTNFVLVSDPKNPFMELLLARRLNKLGASVVFSPMQTMGSLGKKYKLILTLHDLIYYLHPKPPGFLAWPIKIAWRLFHLSFVPVRLLLNRADAVITISGTTRDLIAQRRLTNKPVYVVYNASGMERVKESRLTPATRNLVYMGSFMPYKNVELLIEAISSLPDFTLTLCSPVTSKRKRELLQTVSAKDRERILFLDGTSEDKYRELLDEAFSLVSASKDEGFGIPIIEAMSRAVPVVVSDLKIFREVARNAGVFFDNSNSRDLADQIRKLSVDATWKAASQDALQRSGSFSWSDSAQSLVEVVRGLRE